MKGNEAFAESCLRAGCRFFSGYPITPQTEILEYMSWRMEQVGGQFIQTESELAGINMLFGAACCGARALTNAIRGSGVRPAVTLVKTTLVSAAGELILG